MIAPSASSLFLPLLLFAVVATVTPGPNNILLTASGANFGFRRTLPHMLGIMAGLSTLVVVTGAGVGAAIMASPLLHTILKLLGVAYLLYLAFLLARAGGLGDAGHPRPMRFHEAALFQYANPKAWMMSVGAVTAYTTSQGAYWAELGLIVAVFALVSLPCCSVWVLFGSGIRHWLNAPARLRAFNLGMAALTLLSTVLLFI